MKNKNKTLKIVLPIVLVVALLIILSGSLVVTRANEYTILKQFGAVVGIVDQPGLSLKLPFVQTASTLPKTEMLYDLAVSDVITSDKKSMVASFLHPQRIMLINVKNIIAKIDFFMIVVF